VGDLIFFKGSDISQKKVGHVGIVVSKKKEPIKFIHAGSKGVAISQLNEPYFKSRFKIIRRIKG
jgi:cell wall-associated NlpC family hydrolase